MPRSPYVQSIRERIGDRYLMLPGVTAVLQDDDRFLVARQRDSGRWSLVGGGIEPGEEPVEALRREVLEELGVAVEVHEVVGAYGGAALETTYPNGDRVGYVTVAYRCTVAAGTFTLEQDELIETRWVAVDQLAGLDHHAWIDRVLADALARPPRS